MRVLKRDKTIEEFQWHKVEHAIAEAFKSCEYENIPYEVIDCMKSKYDENCDDTIDVEDIQDDIENCLMETYPTVAKSFIIYRYEHKVLRENRDKLIKGLSKKLMADDIENQNANVDEHSFGGRMGEANRLVTKDYALNYCMSRKSRRNHLNNEIYIHDLDSYAVGMHNCLSIPFDDLLKNGFNTRQTDVRPANSINTAFQLVAVLFQLQSLQQFGGVSATHIDWTMVPYVRKSFFKHFNDGLKWLGNGKNISFDKVEEISIDNERYTQHDKIYKYALEKTLKELKQAVEGMYHNLNTLQSRSGNQLPFTSINYGTCTLTEGRMVTKALLEGSLNGVGKFHKTSIFPCGIFQVMKGVNKEKGTPNYDLFQLALKSTSQRLYPNYANVDWSGNEGYDRNDPRTYFSTMGCHLKDTLIVMNDCKFKPAQYINVGDMVMGIDGKPRTVLGLIKGRGKMFKIKQYSSNDYVVNDEHILSLFYVGKHNLIDCNGNIIDEGTKVNIKVNDFIKFEKNTQKNFKGYNIGYRDGNYQSFGLIDIEIEEFGEDDFYGFELDGDKLYMLADGTVTHNCRTANGFDINAEEGQNPQMKDGRGNICPVTIIMPTLAMEANRDIESFMRLLGRKIEEAKDMLIERFEWICKQSPLSAKFMWENNSMMGYKPEEGIRSALKHGTLAMGQLGLAETLQLLINTDHTTEEGMKLAKRIESLFKKRCAEYKEKYKLNFGVYFTPAENLCYTALKKFRDKYGVIKNVSDKPYFTNSIHVPVWYEMNPFDKIDIESQLTGYSSAGCITYVELPSTTKNNIEAVETIVNYAMDKDIPYFAINVPNDTCCNCGYTDEMNDNCPICGSNKIDRLRRVTGYLTGDYLTAFNYGKQKETEDRIKHIKN